jgi:hypothetical protein
MIVAERETTPAHDNAMCRPPDIQPCAMTFPDLKEIPGAILSILLAAAAEVFRSQTLTRKYSSDGRRLPQNPLLDGMTPSVCY